MSFIAGLTDKIQQNEMFKSVSESIGDLTPDSQTGRKYDKLETEKYSQLVYPEDLLMSDDGMGHFLLININRIEGSRFGDRSDYVENEDVSSGYGITTQESQANSLRKHAYRNHKRSVESIILQMPKQITATYGLDWSTARLGSAGTAINAGNAIINGNFSAAGLAKAAARSLAETAIKITDFVTPGNLEDATQIMLGEQANPYVEVLFKGTNRRDHPLQFSFTPRNERESQIVREIHRRLKFHMHPELKSGVTSSSYLASPSTFDLTFMTVKGPNLWLHRIATSALTNLTINYMEGDEYTVHDDDSPTGMTMDAVFVELETMTKNRFVGENSF